MIKILKYSEIAPEDIFERSESAVNVEDIVNKIESKLLQKQQQEISTKDIVAVALEVLMEVNAMACLVYYTQHTECETFDDVRRFINR